MAAGLGLAPSRRVPDQAVGRRAAAGRGARRAAGSSAAPPRSSAARRSRACHRGRRRRAAGRALRAAQRDGVGPAAAAGLGRRRAARRVGPARARAAQHQRLPDLRVAVRVPAAAVHDRLVHVGWAPYDLWLARGSGASAGATPASSRRSSSLAGFVVLRLLAFAASPRCGSAARACATGCRRSSPTSGSRAGCSLLLARVGYGCGRAPTAHVRAGPLPVAADRPVGRAGRARAARAWAVGRSGHRGQRGGLAAALILAGFMLIDPALLPRDRASRILVTGGAGFVGANLCLALAEQRAAEVVALDSLKRRGSELNLARLREAGVAFVHGDVRERGDLLALEPVEAIVECSAEPSVLAGMGSGADFVVQTNLLGAHNCLELARRDGAQFVFLSTSRVYPVAALSALALREGETRFELEAEQPLVGRLRARDRRGLPARRRAHALRRDEARGRAAGRRVRRLASACRAVIDRCGVIAGPWQMGKVDQGVFTHWLLAHRLGRPLTYIGYGGSGKQVRDLLHVDDLCDADRRAARRPGGLGRRDRQRRRRRRGQPVAAARRRELCRELTGNEVPIEPVLEARPGDVPLYASDCRALFARTDWRPTRGPRTILEDTLAWIEANERAVLTALGVMTRDRAPPLAARAPRVGRARRAGGGGRGPGAAPGALDELLLRRVELRPGPARVGPRRAADAAQRAPLARAGAGLQAAVRDRRASTPTRPTASPAWSCTRSWWCCCSSTRAAASATCSRSPPPRWWRCSGRRGPTCCGRSRSASSARWRRGSGRCSRSTARDRRGDVTAAILLTVALASSSLGIPLLAAAALEVLGRPDRTRALARARGARRALRRVVPAATAARITRGGVQLRRDAGLRRRGGRGRRGRAVRARAGVGLAAAGRARRAARARRPPRRPRSLAAGRADRAAAGVLGADRDRARRPARARRAALPVSRRALPAARSRSRRRAARASRRGGAAALLVVLALVTVRARARAARRRRLPARPGDPLDGVARRDARSPRRTTSSPASSPRRSSPRRSTRPRTSAPSRISATPRRRAAALPHLYERAREAADDTLARAYGSSGSCRRASPSRAARAGARRRVPSSCRRRGVTIASDGGTAPRCGVRRYADARRPPGRRG